MTKYGVFFRDLIKFIYSEKATKFCEIFTFDYSTYSQKLGEDFVKFCGLLRIYELYSEENTHFKVL